MLLQGVVAAVRVVKSYCKLTLIVFSCFYNTLSSLRFDFFALLKLELKLIQFTILPFSGLKDFFVITFRHLLFFSFGLKLPIMYSLEGSFHWGKPFRSIYQSFGKN